MSFWNKIWPLAPLAPPNIYIYTHTYRQKHNLFPYWKQWDQIIFPFNNFEALSKSKSNESMNPHVRWLFNGHHFHLSFCFCIFMYSTNRWRTRIMTSIQGSQMYVAHTVWNLSHFVRNEGMIELMHSLEFCLVYKRGPIRIHLIGFPWICILYYDETLAGYLRDEWIFAVPKFESNFVLMK